MFQNEDEFKKLIEQLKVGHASNRAHESQLRNEVLQAYENSSPSVLKIKLKNTWETIMNSKVTRYAAVIIILLIASYTVGVLNNNSAITNNTNQRIEAKSSSGAEEITSDFQEKFSAINKLYADNNIEAMTDLLRSDDMVSRVIAAELLGKTCDIGAAEILEKLSGDQVYSELAEKFKLAAASIRKNAEGAPADKEENKAAPTGQDVNGVSGAVPGVEKGFFLIKVIDKETKRPISNLNICAQIDVGYDYYKTGNDWFCKVKLTKRKFGYFSVGVQADGYASARFVKDTDNKGYVVPLEYTIEMEKGVCIGGYLENEKGERLKGYKVKVKCERTNSEIDRAYTDIEVYSDADGLWKCNSAPATFDYLKLTGDHSDYVDVENEIAQDSDDHKLARELKYVIQVEKGIAIGGAVKNEEGEVVGGADVEIRCLRMEENGAYNTITKGAAVTDGKGNWQFGKVPDDEQIK